MIGKYCRLGSSMLKSDVIFAPSIYSHVAGKMDIEAAYHIGSELKRDQHKTFVR